MEGWGPIASLYCQRDLAEQQNKMRISCNSKLLCTTLRRSRNRQSHGETASPSRTFFFKARSVHKGSQKFSRVHQSSGPRFSWLELGNSEVVLSSLVLKVGLQ